MEVTELGFILWKPGFKPLPRIAKLTILRPRKVCDLLMNSYPNSNLLNPCASRKKYGEKNTGI